MKPLQPIYRFIIGILVSLLLIVSLIIWLDNPKKPGTSATSVAVQLAIDSVNTLNSKALLQKEDSIQREILKRDSLWQIAYNIEKTKAEKANNLAEKSTRKYEELRAKYAEPCKEVIAECDNRDRIRLAEIQAHQTALVIADNLLTDCKALHESNITKITELVKLNDSHTKTISTLRDRNTTIINRMDRGWLKRNWLWTRGRWREYVLK